MNSGSNELLFRDPNIMHLDSIAEYFMSYLIDDYYKASIAVW